MQKELIIIMSVLLAPQAWAESIPVRVKPLSSLLQHPEFSAPASVKPLNAPSLAAEISARIQVIPVLVGDQVKAGDPLVELDCRTYQSR
ncbi:MAG: biotin/lipoyl-binding protein, partial [Gammaproteobacteria bacterium]|nr:biotin/lipoyl-binding protein [Gammaproteobacteria bacterium]